MALGPLRKAPLLHNALGRFQRHVLARDVAVKDAELATDVGSIELARRTAREGRNALRVRERRVHLLRRRAELILRGHGDSVDRDLAGGGCGGSGLSGRGL